MYADTCADVCLSRVTQVTDNTKQRAPATSFTSTTVLNDWQNDWCHLYSVTSCSIDLIDKYSRNLCRPIAVRSISNVCQFKRKLKASLRYTSNKPSDSCHKQTSNFWIRNWSSCCSSCCCSLLGDALQNSLRLRRLFQIGLGWHLAEYSSTTYASTERVDFCYDVIISRRQPWRHFTQKSAASLPSGKCTRSVHHPAPDACVQQRGCPLVILCTVHAP